MRWYRSAVQFVESDDGSLKTTFKIGAAFIDTETIEKDCDAVASAISITTELATNTSTCS